MGLMILLKLACSFPVPIFLVVLLVFFMSTVIIELCRFWVWIFCWLLGVPQDHTQAWWFIWRLACSHSRNRDLFQLRMQRKWCEVQRKPGQAEESPLPVELHGTRLVPHLKLWQYPQGVVYQGSSLETLTKMFILGSAHVGTCCLACTKIPHDQREGRCLTYTMVFVLTV
jgi:hypothetical protein